MKSDRLRLFVLLVLHMSSESKDEIIDSPDYDQWHADTDRESCGRILKEQIKLFAPTMSMM
jgi:hypothetical protein